MSDLTVFEFEQKEVRFVGTPEKLEWVASDILYIFYPEADKRNHGNYLKKVRNKWKGHKKIMTPGGEQEVATLLEPGLYYLIGRSNSSVAEPFQDWLYEDVLPSIRKTGKYELPTQAPSPSPTPQLLPPTPQEISSVIDLIFQNTAVDPNLVAGAKANAIIKQHPQYAAAIEAAKSALVTPVESNLLNATEVGNKIGKTAREVNKLLLDYGFQIKNPEGKNPSYLATEKGKPHSQMVLETAQGRDKTVQHLRWFESVAEALLEEIEAISDKNDNEEE
ncbi:hypothetical protein CAL7716_085090 [Calothrix sp. PCC 7716]|nr:hypothetical protein CAL7716_085090 [Calothrix sp. PCC 7716]